MTVASGRAALALGSMCLMLAACSDPRAYVSPESVRMAARLKAIAAGMSPQRNPILNAARAKQIRAELDAAADDGRRLALQMALGEELLLAGESAAAVAELTRARHAAAAFGDAALPVQRRISDRLALSYLRLGEQQNCIGGHNSDSCLLPISGSGVYALQDATRHAIREYTALLEDAPDDLAYRWLLNLAYMTVGEHPHKVPPRWVISPDAFRSRDRLPRFLDIAPVAGVAVTGRAGGVVMDDLDGDGWLDLMASSWGLGEQIRFFRNNGDGTFRDRTERAGLIGQTGGLNLIQGDYNNDGHPDVLVLRGAWLGMVGEGDHPSSLLRNNGDGTFDDVTEEAGLLRFRPTQTAAWGDYDGDGWLDLFVGVESTPPQSRPSELYHNNRDGTFVQVPPDAGVDVVGFVKGASWGDYDNDGRPDLYVSRFGQSNRLLRNDGPIDTAVGSHGPHATPRWRFTDVTETARVGEPLNSFATWFWDYDNDGWLDLLAAPFLGFTGRNLGVLVSEYVGTAAGGETPRLYRNNRDGTFADVTASVGLDVPLVVMGANFGDVDADGFPDIYFGTGEPDLATLVPNRMFRNDSGRAFRDVTTAGGFGHLQKGHGIAFGDVDNDGDQDVYAVMGGAFEGDVYQNALFANPGTDNGHVTLRLEGVSSNRSAIGARIMVRVATADGVRDIHSTVTSGGSFGASPLQQTIGLGAARAIRTVEVRWPATGRIQRFDGISMNARYVIREGASAPIRMDAGDAPRSLAGWFAAVERRSPSLHSFHHR